MIESAVAVLSSTLQVGARSSVRDPRAALSAALRNAWSCVATLMAAPGRSDPPHAETSVCMGDGAEIAMNVSSTSSAGKAEPFPERACTARS